MLIYFDGELLAGIVLDDVQNSFPEYGGTVVDGPALPRWREFVEVFGSVDLEFDYCPHHPDEGPYESTDLAWYVNALAGLEGSHPEADPDHPWLEPWKAADSACLERYLTFLDFRRWRAVTQNGEIVAGIPLPPSLDLRTRRFYFRP
ncbi:hypothetical protein SBI_06516 [Streptomyces bingchenggensis BCW-1]|uniref:Uncharacterized protein n=1 Tax=Streptomyces bingchenggensis (strain BCW-1) TaxID=749414 RepID=D7BVQ7_STRBB|nr:hypothetical protein SBI_06516 [Streptomyces bingchenggensis BCW-1]